MDLKKKKKITKTHLFLNIVNSAELYKAKLKRAVICKSFITVIKELLMYKSTIMEEVLIFYIKFSKLFVHIIIIVSISQE